MVSDGKSTLGDNGGVIQQAERAVRTEEGRRIESRSVGKHEWSFGKRGSGMTQEVLGALPELGSRAGRAVLRWRLMRRKTSTDIVKFEFFFLLATLQYVLYKLPQYIPTVPLCALCGIEFEKDRVSPCRGVWHSFRHEARDCPPGTRGPPQ